MQPLILLGPTAVGKTELALQLARELNGEIISADSMQVYRGMDIGTAKPSRAELSEIPHYLIDVRNPDQEWTVSDFIKEAEQLTSLISGRGKLPIITGGTGLYLWSLLEDFSFPIAPGDPELRARLEKIPPEVLYNELKEVDPPAAAKIHPHDKKRVIRALEVLELTGQPISELQKNRRKIFEKKKSAYLLIGLDRPREELYQRIEQRVDQMIGDGLIEEVAGLLSKGYKKELPSLQALGYKETMEHLEGRWTKAELAAELKKKTRNFARRQLTWFRRFQGVRWFSPFDKGEIIEYILSNDQDKTTRDQAAAQTEAGKAPGQGRAEKDR